MLGEWDVSIITCRSIRSSLSGSMPRFSCHFSFRCKTLSYFSHDHEAMKTFLLDLVIKVIFHKQWVSAKANHVNHIIHDETVVSLKVSQTQTCVKLYNTWKIESVYAFGSWNFRSHSIAMSLLLFLLPRCTGPLLCSRHILGGLCKEHCHAVFSFHIQKTDYALVRNWGS